MFLINEISKFIRKRNRKKYEISIIKNNKYGFELNKKEKRICLKKGFNYSEYGVYRANGDDISHYISSLDSFLPRENNGDLMAVSDNKLLFPYVFGNYFKVAHNYACIMGGRVLSLNDSGLNEKTIFDFLKKNDFIIKPYGGCDGKGIMELRYNPVEDGFYINNEKVVMNDILTKIKELDKYVIQERLQQHPFFSALYPKSLNTIRIISARTGNSIEHEIICAVQRIGADKSAPADNFSKGGFSAIIDLETGRLSKATGAKSIDKEGKRIFYSKHPEINSRIENQIVPKWSEIKNAIIVFSKKFPMYNFIAWDISINETGEIILIETNMKSSLSVFQAHGGLKGTKLDMILQSYKTKR